MTLRKEPTLASMMRTGLPRGLDWSWQEDAACRGQNIFFCNEDKASAMRQSRKAKEICRSCDVRTECLDFALAINVQYGIWGGMARKELASERRRRAQRARRIREDYTLC